jgi:GDP-L-fucose synthase
MGTGETVREFLYLEDCADANLLATERYEDVTPMNSAPGIGISIRDLTELIRNQAVKLLDTTRMKQHLGWMPSTSLSAGLRQTIAWYGANKNAADARF